MLIQADGEKTLHGILRVVRALAQATREGVEGIPVSLTKRLQSRARAGRVAASGREHDAPVRGGEAIIAVGCR